MDFKDNEMFVECENGFEMYCLCCDQTIASSPANLRNHLIPDKHIRNEDLFHKDTEIASQKNFILELSGKLDKMKENWEYEHEKRMKYLGKLSECRDERNALKSQLEDIEQRTEHTAYHEIEIERLKEENEDLTLKNNNLLRELVGEKQRREKFKTLRNEHQQELVKRDEFWENVRVENNDLKDKMYEMKEQIEGDQVHKQNAQKTIAELRETIEIIKKTFSNLSIP